MIDLINSEREILLYLATNGPAFGGQMSKSTGLSSRTVSTAPRSLEKKGLVSHIITQESRAKKEYSLTILGLSHALTLIRPEELNPIIERWVDLLPLVLKKWEYFINAGFNDLAQNSLFLTAFEFCKNYWSDVELLEAVEDGFDESWRNMMDLMRPYKELDKFQASFYGYLFRLNAILSPKKKRRLVKTCKSDPEILVYLVDSFTKANDEFKSGSESMKKLITQLS